MECENILKVFSFTALYSRFLFIIGPEISSHLSSGFRNPS